MVTDEILRTLGNPGEVADAQLASVPQGDRERQASGVRECGGATGGPFGRIRARTGLAQMLCAR